MKYLDKIEAYLNGQMNEEEIRSFEAQLNKDSELAAEFAIQKFEQEAISLAAEDDLRGRIKSIQSDAKNSINHLVPKVISIRRWLKPLAIAASFLLIVGYLFESNKYSNESLVKAHYTYSSDDFLRGNGDASVLSDAKKLFDNGDFNGVIKSLDKVSPDSPFSIKADYLLAHAYFKKKDFQKASLFFKKIFVEKEKAGHFKDAQWYWLLSNLEEGNQDDEFYNSYC
ncbi:MAG: hypothetical protein R2788_19875 [Saprospiraceae bacterium]